jgi:hypothetical protein
MDSSGLNPRVRTSKQTSTARLVICRRNRQKGLAPNSVPAIKLRNSNLPSLRGTKSTLQTAYNLMSKQMASTPLNLKLRTAMNPFFTLGLARFQTKEPEIRGGPTNRAR